MSKLKLKPEIDYKLIFKLGKPYLKVLKTGLDAGTLITVFNQYGFRPVLASDDVIKFDALKWFEEHKIRARFAEDWLLEMAVNMSSHAKERATSRDGKPVGISRDMIQQIIDKNEQKILAFGQRHPTLILKKGDLNIVGALDKEGGSYVFDVITVMKKSNFHPNNPYDRMVTMKELSVQQQQQVPQYTKPTQSKPNFYTKPSQPSSLKRLKRLPKPAKAKAPARPALPAKQRVPKVAMTTPWNTPSVVNRATAPEKMSQGYSFVKNVDAKGRY